MWICHNLYQWERAKFQRHATHIDFELRNCTSMSACMHAQMHSCANAFMSTSMSMSDCNCEHERLHLMSKRMGAGMSISDCIPESAANPMTTVLCAALTTTTEEALLWEILRACTSGQSHSDEEWNHCLHYLLYIEMLQLTWTFLVLGKAHEPCTTDSQLAV